MLDNHNECIIIADDHAIIRLGLKLIISENFNYTIYEAENGNELFELVKKYSPEMVLLDINMPDTNTQGILQNMLALKPDLNVLVFSVNKEEIYGKLYLKLGARGYIQKEASSEEIVKAIKCILDGNLYIRKQMQSLYLGTKSPAQDASPYSVLTKKEFEILHYLSKGDSVMSIARVMNLSSSTIGTHKANIFTKLHIFNILELIEFTQLNPLS